MASKPSFLQAYVNTLIEFYVKENNHLVLSLLHWRLLISWSFFYSKGRLGLWDSCLAHVPVYPMFHHRSVLFWYLPGWPSRHFNLRVYGLIQIQLTSFPCPITNSYPGTHFSFCHHLEWHQGWYFKLLFAPYSSHLFHIIITSTESWSSFSIFPELWKVSEAFVKCIHLYFPQAYLPSHLSLQFQILNSVGTGLQVAPAKVSRIWWV